MISCSFNTSVDASPDLIDQIKTYCLRIVPDGMVSKALFNDQLLFVMRRDSYYYEFLSNVCSAFTYESTKGNRITYTCNDMEVVIYLIDQNEV